METAARERRPDPRSTATRQALVDAAVASLGEVGFHRASAREVARRSGCNQAQVFYHFGTVVDLHLAALSAVSERRMAAFAPLIQDSRSLADLVDAARSVLRDDLAYGDLRVLVELIGNASSVTGMSERVTAELAPWEDLALGAVRGVLAEVPLGFLAPAADIAHLVVAGVLGLELLTSVAADRTRLEGLLDRAHALAEFLDERRAAGAGTAGPRADGHDPTRDNPTSDNR